MAYHGMDYMSINGALSADLWGHDDGEWILNLLSYYTLLSVFFNLREHSLFIKIQNYFINCTVQKCARKTKRLASKVRNMEVMEKTIF